MDLKKYFGTDLIRTVRKTPKTKMINALMKQYFDEILEQARQNPKSFGSNSTMAEDDPRGLARQYTQQFRSALLVRGREPLEMLYAHQVKDNNEIETEAL